ncbi:hypothetical protein OE88DRAFT_1689331 [Heliocybe sulcata]|uniref:HNH nuclease domain-containing protein n=1 Tax=Heliocybe sulcata TaxID=5364 RepID=A0A5C3NG53_9AGAM|nr:hypothetical protein OE88DRAFT_1689331 [Heliocybe sulcata]
MLLEPAGPVPLHDDFSHKDETIAAAYCCCCEDEKEVLQELEKTPGNSSLTIDLMNIRIIGHLIDILSQYKEQHAAAYISKTIMSCGAKEKRIEVGAFYNKYLIKAFWCNRTRRPASSNESSPRSFDSRQEVNKDELGTASDEYTSPQDHRTAKKWGLVRDNYRCVATKKIDMGCEEDIPPDALTTYTYCTHIFPELTNTNLDDPTKSEYAASTWAVLEAFGYRSIVEDLKGSNIHRLDNVLTLEYSVLIAFDELRLWFEATDVANCYKAVTSHKNVLGLGVPDTVTFETADERLALPNPTYLRLHALCCKVAHLSGALEYYKQLEDDDIEYDPYGPVPADVLTARLHDISTTSPYPIESV